MIPLVGYAPDLDNTLPGILTNCSAFIPGLKGMESAPSAQSGQLPALASAARGAAVLRKLDNSTRFIAGTTTHLYEAATTSWTDVVRVSGNYSLGSDTLWRFAQYSDQTLAAAKSEILQVSSSGAFDDAAADAPKAAIVEIANGFVMLFDVNDQGAVFDSADRPHGWWAARSTTTWTPSVANEAYTGSLTSTAGKIRAARVFGSAVIVYKDRSMYQGIYAGQSGWDFTLIPGEIGAMSQEVVVNVGTERNPVHIFMGFEDFYIFDGSRPTPIGTPLQKTVFTELNKQYSYTSRALHDRVNKRVFFYYPVGSSVQPDRCVVYNYKTNQWGRDDRTIEAAVEFIGAGLTYNDLGSVYATYNDLPDLTYDSSFWTAGYPTPAIFNSSHVVQTLDGPVGMSTMTTGDYGLDEQLSLLSRVQPQFLSRPSSASMTNYYRDNLGDALTTDQTVTMDSKGRFDVYRTANWHRALFNFTGTTVIPGLRADMQVDGLE